MPSPKDGKARSAVTPADPDEAKEADIADPGKVEEIKTQQRQRQTGKYSSVQVKPYKPPQTDEEMEKKRSWIEIELVDEEGDPVPGEKYRITLSDGQTQAEGALDEKGFARLEGIEPGTCRVTFPDLDQEAWKKA